MLMLGAFTVCVDIIVDRISCVSGVCSVRNTLLKKTRLPGVAILDEEDPDPPHHCPRCAPVKQLSHLPSRCVIV